MRLSSKSWAIFVLNSKRTNEEIASSYPHYFDEKDGTNFELTGLCYYQDNFACTNK